MMKTYNYNRKAAKALLWILREAKKQRGMTYRDILMHLNLNGIDMSYRVLTYIFGESRRNCIFPVELFAIMDVLNLDPERVYCALLLTINGDPRAKQAMEDAVPKGK